MVDKKRPTRLAKAAKEFNVGVHTIVEFLHKKGFKEVEDNLNYKLMPEMVDLVAKEFQSEKSLKDEAAKLEIDYKKLHAESEKKTTVKATPAKELEPELESADLYIKDGFVPSKPQVKEEKPAAKPVPQPHKPEAEVEKAPAPAPDEKPEKQPAETKPQVEESVIPAPQPEVKKAEITPPPEPSEEKPSPREKEEIENQTKPQPVPESEKPKQEVTAQEGPKKQEPEEEVTPKTTPERNESDDSSNLRILGTINLDEMNQRTRPPRKSKEEKQKDRQDRKKPEPKQQAQGQKTPHQAKPQQPVNPEPSPEPAQPSKPIEEKPVTQGKEKPDNFLETKVEKLAGVKILGSIELPVEKKPEKKKPVASSTDSIQKRKKRKRIHKPGETKPQDQNRPQQKQNSSARDNKAKPKKRKEIAKPEVSDEDVQKQISETLKQLESRGKSKASKHRRDKRAKVHQTEQADMARREAEKRVLKVTEFVTVSELATMMEVPPTNVISTCMSLGLFVSINQRLDAETLSLIAEEFGFTLEFVSVEVQEAIDEDMESSDEKSAAEPRHPIVTVMGHVDHGKTSLLDYIRHTNVIAGEAGGITQHIGAYEVTLEDNRKITFLDTPGHEAFTAMRARGAQVTDVAIIVIAADDKVMPQTIEAINHAQAAGVPIVFALNKIDKPNANTELIREGLANMNILVEDWGGKYQSQEISAKKGINIEKLLDKVLLEAEILELSGHPHNLAKGTVLESSLDKGRGYLVKLLVQDGTLHVGDMVLAGAHCGRVRALHNERNQIVTEAGPSTPVLMLGLSGAPQAGDGFNVLADEARAKKIAAKRQQLQREQGIRTQKHITLDEIGRRIAVGNFKELNIIVKGDVDGSVEALCDSLLKLSNDEVQVTIIHKSVGQITDSDVLLATASDAIIIGFQVRPSLSARKLAESEQIDIRLYSVIYDAINELKDAI
ncbi:MAG: translation initiation factor IF-2, partial [Bacteroidia bacterium]|nr:translation initiation factor IF-2 [Bacteroidia bacterium]